MSHWLKYMILAIFLLFLVSIPLAKQFEDGSLEGVVTNERGPVVNASIEARNIMSGAVANANTDARGYYRIDSLRAGRYSLWVRAEKHNAMWIPRVMVERGQMTRQDVRLSRAESIIPTSAQP
jgi:hypothetical protein